MATPVFEIDMDSDLPPWVQLRDRLAYLIASGFYQPNDQLPTVRGLAASLRISYNTVCKAYVALEREGYISTTRGRGSFVCSQTPDPDALDVDIMIEEFVKGCLERGMTYDDIPKRVSMCIRRLEQSHEGE